MKNWSDDHGRTEIGTKEAADPFSFEKAPERFADQIGLFGMREALEVHPSSGVAVDMGEEINNRLFGEVVEIVVNCGAYHKAA